MHAEEVEVQMTVSLHEPFPVEEGFSHVHDA